MLIQLEIHIYFNMRYPEDYKSNDTRIVKFEANHFNFRISFYRFISIIIEFNKSFISKFYRFLRQLHQFSYDRYVCGESSSLARALGIDMNKREGGPTKDGISRNTVGFLNEVQSGLPLLNEDVAYTLSSDFTSVNYRQVLQLLVLVLMLVDLLNNFIDS